MERQTSRNLKMLGMILFLLGLMTGFVIMALENPRMGLAAHLEGVMNGTFLVVVGLVWVELKITPKLKSVLYWTMVIGTFTNWIFTLLSAIFGTSQMNPLAGAGYSGTEIQETLVTAGFSLVGLTMVFSLVVIIYGLRGRAEVVF